MPHTIVLGGGLCGLAAALMLARDGHRVTVLERDPAPVPSDPEAAWERWNRAGVAQFRQAHYLQPRGREVLDAELPDVREALADAGALRFDPLQLMPPTITDREPRAGDERFVTWTARRSTIEQVLARAAEAQDGLEVRRGVSVAALETRRADGRVHVTAVRTTDGERIAGSLFVDAMGRGSVLPRLLEAAGGSRVPERSADSGFLYYTRFFRGERPQPRAALDSTIGSFSLLTLPADNDTWSITVSASSRDQALKTLRDPARWNALVRACPRHAHWLDGKPLTDVLAMGGIVDRIRNLSGNGGGPALGLLSLGDAWATTNPTLGRGMTFGLAHAAVLRRAVRECGDHPAALAARFAADTERDLAPWFAATVAADRARLAQLDAARTGTAPAPGNPVASALGRALALDAEVFRAAMEITSCLALPDEVFSRPGLAERVLELAADAKAPALGPGREQLLTLLR